MDAIEGTSRQDKDKADDKRVETIMKAAQTHLVVATLLVTVTFAAGFTLPGGFDSDTKSPNKGTAVLIRNAAFCAFVVTDAIAFACSAGTMFMYFVMAEVRRDPKSYGQVYPLILDLYNDAVNLQGLAMYVVVIAFVTVRNIIRTEQSGETT
ncbi:hypothetical protein HAX54_000327 [Datura stramonium]|uniref:PGG domain-containing protein n=1 Tax=Datura stramonium TaxID=4076 RepID=A0ABS8T1J1_DATST|nr:hypothetical protein [Datura stramonium]